MADADPETLLEWLNMGQGDERDMQLIALEQLCMLLLMSDNVDRCFERCVALTPLLVLLECRVGFSAGLAGICSLALERDFFLVFSSGLKTLSSCVE